MTKEEQKSINDLMREINELAKEIKKEQPESASQIIQNLLEDIFSQKIHNLETSNKK